MKKYYSMPDANIISDFLGMEESAVAVHRIGRLYCKVNAKLLDRAKAKVRVRFRDYDGSQFQYLIDVRNRLACFEEDYSEFIFNEHVLLDQVWQKTVEVINATLG